MDTYIIALLFAIPIFIFLIGLEAFVAFRRDIQVNRAADMISSLSSGLTNSTRDGIQFGFILISYSWLVDHITIFQVEPLWLAIIIAFILEDFALLFTTNFLFVSRYLNLFIFKIHLYIENLRFNFFSK